MDSKCSGLGLGALAGNQDADDEAGARFGGLWL